MKVIVTIPPYAPFLKRLAKHPMVAGVRFNTVMPTKDTLDELLIKMKGIFEGKDIWVDLKCRQLRTSHGFFFKAPEEPRRYKIGSKIYILDSSCPKAHGILRSPPWCELKIDRKIKVDLSKGPITCWFGDGHDKAQLVEVIDGDTLIMLDGPKRIVGGGESINIMDDSLEIEGYFTDKDLRFIEAAKKADIHTYMLSFVEKNEDVKSLMDLDDKAKVLAKIESAKGISWATENYKSVAPYESVGTNVHLMAARGDLYVEMGTARPEKVLKPLKQIIDNDSDAVLASRILGSLKDSPRPSCSDITDIACMLQLGYKTFMLGDDICFSEDSLMLALDILSAVDKECAAW